MKLLRFFLQPKIGLNRAPQTPETTRRNLINREASIGGQLFGPLPAGHTRSFFCLDPDTWVWHEGWRDQNGKDTIVTTRYEIQNGRIMKIQDGQPYQYATLGEVRNLLTAARLYGQRVKTQVYGLSS